MNFLRKVGVTYIPTWQELLTNKPDKPPVVEANTLFTITEPTYDRLRQYDFKKLLEPTHEISCVKDRYNSLIRTPLPKLKNIPSIINLYGAPNLPLKTVGVPVREVKYFQSMPPPFISNLRLLNRRGVNKKTKKAIAV